MSINHIVAAMDHWATGLTGNEYKLLVNLCEQVNQRTGEVAPKLEKEDSIVRRRMGCSRTSVYAALNGLLQKGAVEYVKPGQKHQNAVLRIVLPNLGKTQRPENPDADESQRPGNPDPERENDGSQRPGFPTSASRFSDLSVPETRTPSPTSPYIPSSAEPRSQTQVAVVPSQREGEEINEETNITVAMVREMKPRWSSSAIRKALEHPDVRERGDHELIRTAMLIVARDPDSKYPSRLAQQGPWWGEAADMLNRRAEVARCDDERHDQDNPKSRLLYDPETKRPIGKCPECHPDFTPGAQK